MELEKILGGGMALLVAALLLYRLLVVLPRRAVRQRGMVYIKEIRTQPDICWWITISNNWRSTRGREQLLTPTCAHLSTIKLSNFTMLETAVRQGKIYILGQPVADDTTDPWLKTQLKVLLEQDFPEWAEEVVPSEQFLNNMLPIGEQLEDTTRIASSSQRAGNPGQKRVGTDRTMLELHRGELPEGPDGSVEPPVKSARSLILPRGRKG